MIPRTRVCIDIPTLMKPTTLLTSGFAVVQALVSVADVKKEPIPIPIKAV
jgi:hypothetical protein